jgi:hypothetical protein
MRSKLMASGMLPVLGIAGMLGISLLAGDGARPGIPSAALATQEPVGGASGEIVLSFGVGGVLTGDGTLWIYRPDLEKWFTMDEAFAEEGRETHVLPLPVPVSEIRDMSTYGFIVTTTGQIWLYEHATDRWRQLPPPRS